MASSGCGAAGALTAAAAPQLSWRIAIRLGGGAPFRGPRLMRSSPVEWCSAAISFVMGQAVSAGS